MPSDIYQHQAAEASEERPWTAEINCLHEGYKPKYNLPVDAADAALVVPSKADVLSATAKVQRSPSTKVNKELWAASAPKGVDTMREPVTVPATTGAGSIVPGQQTTSEKLMQGFFVSRHPTNRDS